MNQAPEKVLMIRPQAFGYNPETAQSNVFQQKAPDEDGVSQVALKEFDIAIKTLKKAGIDVLVYEDTSSPYTPDAIFPNNWLVSIPEGILVIGAMESALRRAEKRQDIIDDIQKQYPVVQVIDLSENEESGRYLEGTGSMVFNHHSKKAYACPSSRTDETLVKELCEKIGYEPVLFASRDEDGKEIYHTNVLLSIGSRVAVVCLDAIHPADHEEVLESLAEDELKVISISYEQMRAMAGNILEVQTKSGENVIVMSEQALGSLLPGQVNALTQHIDVISVDIPTIEKVGGGGIRCMLAGIHR